MRFILFLWLAATIACGGSTGHENAVMSAADALALPRPAADHRLAYGDDPLQFGELRLPEGDGPYPVVIVIHGGCWLAEYDLDTIVPVSQAHAFAEAARQMGDSVAVVEIVGAGHFELVDPTNPAFETIRQSVVEAMRPAWTE